MSTTTIQIQATTGEVIGPSAQREDQNGQKAVPPPRIKEILTAVDFSDSSRAALAYAASLAEGAGATLTLIHAVQPQVYAEDLAAGFTTAEVDAHWIKEHEDQMATIQQTVQPGIPSKVIVKKGPAWKQILETAKSEHADLIVMGTHGRTGVKDALIGSTAERVVRHAHCPVLVVPLPAH